MKFKDVNEKLSSLKVGETAYFILPTDFIPSTNYHNLPMVEQELCSFEQVMYTSEPVFLIKALEDEGFIVALASIKGSWLSRSIESCFQNRPRGCLMKLIIMDCTTYYLAKILSSIYQKRIISMWNIILNFWITQNTGEVAAAFMRAEESPFLFFGSVRQKCCF